MISERELIEAIQECENAPASFQNCERLSVLYTVYDHLFSKADHPSEGYRQEYSSRSEGQRKEKISVPIVTSEFLRLVEGMDVRQFWDVTNELVSTIEVINPKLYEGFLKKLKEAT